MLLVVSIHWGGVLLGLPVSGGVWANQGVVSSRAYLPSVSHGLCVLPVSVLGFIIIGRVDCRPQPWVIHGVEGQIVFWASCIQVGTLGHKLWAVPIIARVATLVVCTQEHPLWGSAGLGFMVHCASGTSTVGKDSTDFSLFFQYISNL